jgi:hypothetical protein
MIKKASLRDGTSGHSDHGRYAPDGARSLGSVALSQMEGHPESNFF